MVADSEPIREYQVMAVYLFAGGPEQFATMPFFIAELDKIKWRNDIRVISAAAFARTFGQRRAGRKYARIDDQQREIKSMIRDGRLFFDETEYLKAYPDVSRAIELGEFSDGLNHFLRHGASEGRAANIELRSEGGLTEEFYFSRSESTAKLARSTESRCHVYYVREYSQIEDIVRVSQHALSNEWFRVAVFSDPWLVFDIGHKIFADRNAVPFVDGDSFNRSLVL